MGQAVNPLANFKYKMTLIGTFEVKIVAKTAKKAAKTAKKKK